MRYFSLPKVIIGVVSQTIKVQWDWNTSIENKIYLQIRSKDCMQSWDLKTLGLSDFKRAWRLDALWGCLR